MPKTEQRPSGVAITYPEPYRLVAEPPELREGRTRGVEGNGKPDPIVGDWLADALRRQDLEEVDRVALAGPTEADPARTRSATALSEPAAVALDVEVPEGRSAVVLMEEDGYYRWVLPLDPTGTRSRGLEPTEGVRTIRFEIRLGSPPGESAERGPWDFVRKKIAGRVVAWVFSFAARKAAGLITNILERNVVEGLVVIHAGGSDGLELDPARWTPWRGDPPLRFSADDDPRVLLLVHGTFSSTEGSYGALAVTDWGQAFLKAARERYDLILGFDHATLRVDPEHNALALRSALQAIDWKGTTPTFDGVSFSRGVLVLRSLIESVGVSPFRFEKAVFVGGTNGGTQLAEPDNWKDLVDLYTNLVAGSARVLTLLGAGAAPSIVSGMFSSLGSLVKHLAAAAVTHGGIPGLAAMEPDGIFVRRLNMKQPDQPKPEDIEYFAITADFEPGGADSTATGLPTRFLQMLIDGVADRLMGVANDLVVHTDSMTSVDPVTPGYIREVCEFGRNPRVYHTIYFAQQETVAALHQWLIEGAIVAGGVRHMADLPLGGERGAGGPWKLPTSWTPLPVRFGAPTPPARRRRAPEAPPPEIEVSVVWGDIREVDADAYAVGHYQGVLPQRAELALDEIVSGTTAPERLVLTQLTRRGLLVGRLGEISLFPCAGQPGRQVAVCGMGHPGSFDEVGLRLLHGNLATALSLLPDRKRLAMVLIGSGEGTIEVAGAVRAFLEAFAEALEASPHVVIREVVIVEMLRHKAEEIQEVLLADNDEPSSLYRVVPGPVTGTGGAVTEGHRLALLLTGAVEACRSNTKLDQTALDRILKLIPFQEPMTPHIAQATRDALLGLVKGGQSDLGAVARALLAQVGGAWEPGSRNAFPTRISFIRDGDLLRAAAITQTATVPERVIDVDPNLITQGVRRMSDPAVADAETHASVMYRLIVPAEFRALFAGAAPLVLEVDRHTAAVHWEMMPVSGGLTGQQRPAGLVRPVSRQLRTGYSTVGSRPATIREAPRALVIGDPGDPAQGHDLRFARIEAEAVADHLYQHGFVVDLMVGPDGTRATPGPVRAMPAARFDALARLLERPYDLVHYAGHGDYDARDPSRTGWLFADGLLRAGEVRRVEHMPALVFANACLSSELSRTDGAPADLEKRPFGEAGLLASLADEFMGRGARNYIGTAWTVDDQGAVEFALKFYSAFIGPNGAAGATIGQAMLDARRKIASDPQKYRCLWAAYQHYGDPHFTADDV